MRKSKISLTELREVLRDDGNENIEAIKKYRKTKNYEGESFRSGFLQGRMHVYTRILELVLFGKDGITP